MQKYSINFIALILFLFSLPAFSEPPTLLELRLMQSREYSISKVDFLEAVSETCRARGGHLAGFYPFKKAGMSDAQNKVAYNLNSTNFYSGNIICINYNHGRIAAKKISNVNFRIQGKSISENALEIRIIAAGTDSNLPLTHGPINHADVYEVLFKDISDAVGVMAIPIKLKSSE